MLIEPGCVAAAGAGSGAEARADGEEFRLLAEQRQQEVATVWAELEETRKELQEASEALEERGREADESLDKYCGLIVRVHKLEETNEALTARLQSATTTTASQTPTDETSSTSSSSTSSSRRSKRLSRRQEVALEHGAENEAPSPPLPGSPARPSPLGKRLHLAQRDATHTPAKAQEALHNMTKRIKAQAAMATTPKPGSERDEEFKPEGLPELVQRGGHLQCLLYESHLQNSFICCTFVSYPVYSPCLSVCLSVSV